MNMQYLLYVLTNGISQSHGLSNLHKDLKTQVFMKNFFISFIYNFNVVF